MDITTQHAEMVSRLIVCAPGSERARELRVMIRWLEAIKPALEQRRIEMMKQRLEKRHAR